MTTAAPATRAPALPAIWLGPWTRLLVAVGAYIVGAQLLLARAEIDAEDWHHWLSAWAQLYPVFLGGLAYLGLCRLALMPRHCRAEVWRRWVTWPAVGRVLAVGVVVPAFHRAFSVYKTALPHLIPFWADRWLLPLDRGLHFGRLPHEWLAWTMPAGLPLMAQGYLWWHFILLAVTIYVAAQPDDRWRLRVAVAFVATWILLGNLLAVLGMSAGPWGYELVTGLPGPYGPHLGALWTVERTQGWHLVGSQPILWANLQGATVALGGGVSAFPSLHVAIPALFAVAFWRHARWVALLWLAFALLIFVSSIVLAWHYAVDGYASLAGVALIWRATRRLA